jgi:glycosyltransferase involved in cell wall biosynthesis
MSKIGIAIPTYNRNKFLIKLLDTIASDIEVFVSDNGGFVTESIKLAYPNAQFDSFKEVIPAFDNWNRAIRGLHSDWVCLSSDDDMFLENAFATVEKIIQKNPTAEVIIFGNETIDATDKVTSVWMPTAAEAYEAPDGFYPFRYGVDAKMIGVFFKKDLYLSVGGFNESYKVTAGDSCFVQKLLLAGKTVYVQEAVSQYRMWSHNGTSQMIATKSWMDEIVIWQDEIGAFLKQKGVSEDKRRHYKDEVIARNMLAGMSSVLSAKQGFMGLLRYVKPLRYPVYAHFKTQLSIVKCLLLSLVKR